ncbi:GNAT family N-acetyltransferase [Aeromonas salmonicida]|uniref:GNAT family N-acetyltransferase n=1 Tax=Aeromonas salmonicida TaxID=645 RepID=UPI00131518B8|nr:GNAT family N-acetyltransferase [Aeromonas salmonicida]
MKLNVKVQLRIETLNDKTQTVDFDCGDNNLNDYIKGRALKEQAVGACVVHCVVDANNKLYGFITLTNSVVERKGSGSKLKKHPYPTIPSVLIGRLAVDKVTRKEKWRLGSKLIAHATLIAQEMAKSVGVRALTVDAVRDVVSFYQKLGFHTIKDVEGKPTVLMTLPLP